MNMTEHKDTTFTLNEEGYIVMSMCAYDKALLMNALWRNLKSHEGCPYCNHHLFAIELYLLRKDQYKWVKTQDGYDRDNQLLDDMDSGSSLWYITQFKDRTIFYLDRLAALNLHCAVSNDPSSFKDDAREMIRAFNQRLIELSL